MKATNYLFIILTVGVLALVGCGKSDKEAKPTRRPGVVDLSQVQQAFPNPTPEVNASLEKVRFACRYRTFDPALPELDKLLHMPNLTDPQKKALDDVLEQIKTAMNMGAGEPPK
jgi:hypothetical protein